MSSSELIVGRDISSMDLDEIKELIKNFNNSHSSSLGIFQSNEESITLRYKSIKGVEFKSFKTPRETERWIRYTHFATDD